MPEFDQIPVELLNIETVEYHGVFDPSAFGSSPTAVEPKMASREIRKKQVFV